MRSLAKRVGQGSVSLLAAGAALIGAGGGAAAARTVDLGGAGWRVQSSAIATASGRVISRPGFDAGSWLLVRNDDGGAPGTEVGALVANGACPHVYVAAHLARCFGYMRAVGRVTVRRFAVPWWYRTTFDLARVPATATLAVNGVVGAADIYVDGDRVATRATVQGAFARYAFPVARLLRPGRNVVALRLYPNDPNTMFTLDNVDWTQIPPDNDTGIQFPVQLHTSGPLSLSGAHVVQRDAADLSRAALTVKGTVTNDGPTARIARLRAEIDPPHGAHPIVVGAAVRIPAHGTRRVVLRPAAHPALRIAHPAVWWPIGMGAHPLYRLRMSVARSAPGSPADSTSQTFGIRTVRSRLVGASPLAPAGSRQFLVNGVPFVFRGGGWSEDLLLHYSDADTARQIRLIENLGLNGIRTEGHVMPQRFYEQMDRAGILVDAGYQCCDAWQLQDSKLTSAHDLRVLARSAATVGMQLRDHPSVFTFGWSDDQPTPAQERVSVAAFRAVDFDVPLVASAEYKSSRGLGPSGEKEGPYDWVPPSYWYDRTHINTTDPTRTDVGGAWGFDSEASAGATIPTLDSLRRFLSPRELRALWREPDANQYHLNYERGLPGPANGGYAFGTLHDLDTAMRHRYGPWTSLRQYVEEAQIANYETQRAEFEAYIANSRQPQAPSTGVVYWQLNKGWPSLLWTLYDGNGDEPGSYFGAQEANRPLHAFYDYGTGTVGIANLSRRSVAGLSVSAAVYSVAGDPLWSARSTAQSLSGEDVSDAVLTPTVPAATAPPTRARTYFVDLVLRRAGQAVDRNTYWLSTQPDEVDWAKTVGWPQATMTSWANLRGLRTLAPAQVTVTAHSRRAGGDRIATVRLHDTAGIAFFLRADLRRGTAAGRPLGGDDEVTPALWSADDTTLFPGQSETLRVRYPARGLHGATPVITVSGENVPAVAVPVR